MTDESIERILDFDGWRFWLVNGWSYQFEIRVVETTEHRPHGIRYSFTLYDVDKSRLLAFENNSVYFSSRVEFDHRHPFRNVDRHIPYDFVNADKLLIDFQEAIENACDREGIPFEIEYQERERRATMAKTT